MDPGQASAGSIRCQGTRYSRNTQSRVGLRAVSGQSITWGKVSPFALQTQGSGVRP